MFRLLVIAKCVLIFGPVFNASSLLIVVLFTCCAYLEDLPHDAKLIFNNNNVLAMLTLICLVMQVAGIGSVHPSSLQSLGSPPAEDSFEGRLAVFVGDLQTGFTSEDVFKLQTDLKEKDVTYEV